LGDFTFTNEFESKRHQISYKQFQCKLANGCFKYVGPQCEHVLVNDFTMTLIISIKKEDQ
jgi:hypothetical protein